MLALLTAVSVFLYDDGYHVTSYDDSLTRSLKTTTGIPGTWYQVGLSGDHCGDTSWPLLVFWRHAVPCRPCRVYSSWHMILA